MSRCGPQAVADYTYDPLPPAARDAVPTATELAATAGTSFTHPDTGASQPPRAATDAAPGTVVFGAAPTDAVPDGSAAMTYLS